MLTIRNLDPETDKVLREKARREGKSINAVVLEILQAGLLPARKRCYHDLDALVGAWSSDEADRFDAALDQMSVIDEDVWK